MTTIPQPDPAEVGRTARILDELRALTAAGRWAERHALLWSSAEAIRGYLHSFRLEGAPSDFVPAYVNDALARFFHTIDLLAADPRQRVLEIGANPYLFTLLLRRLYDFDLTLTNFFSKSVYETATSRGGQTIASEAFGEKHEFGYTTLNVELSDYPWADGTFDTVLFCEVLEHIVVDPFQCFPKLLRVLKPGGRLVITTPNAVRLINVAHMLAGSNFFDRYHPQNGIYGRHNREYTLAELRLLLPRFGFEVEVAKTLDRYNYDHTPMHVDSYEESTRLPWTPAQLRAALEAAGASTADRGDNLYVVARKPVSG